MKNNYLLKIRPVRESDMEALKAVAAQDGHVVVAPTYVVEKGDQMIGYIGVVPSVLIWLDQDRSSIRDSIQVMNFYENILLAQGVHIIGVPCSDKSPLKPFLPRVGYVGQDEMTMFFKNLNP